jgi:hypothetical protein
VDFMFVWTICGLYVFMDSNFMLWTICDCVFNIYVLWILYEFSVIFCIFSNFFSLKFLIFNGLPSRQKIVNIIFGGSQRAAENNN